MSEKLEGVSATYSAEDNKLRIYSEHQIDKEIWREFQEAGYNWTMKQDSVLVAHKWTPAREDIALKYAGEITAEGSTVLERAEAKAERLDALATKREGQSAVFFEAAQRISQRFEHGQPILVGHHSEKKARKDKERMESAMDQSVNAAKAVDYWNYRAEGVERHANRKNDPKVRARRIKTLLAELRDHQRDVNRINKNLELWTKASKLPQDEKSDKLIKFLAGGFDTRAYDSWSALDKGEITAREVCDESLRRWVNASKNPNYMRWVSHTLNRLAFERSELGDVERFEGDLTPVILQAFSREHGAEKPKASKDGENWKIISPVVLPVHLADGKELLLSDDAMRDLMQACGYKVVIKAKRAGKKQACSLLNVSPEEAAKLQEYWNILSSNSKYGGPSKREETTQKTYSANSQGDYGCYKTITLDENSLRIWARYNKSKSEHNQICRIRISTRGSGIYHADRVLSIIDKPYKPLPFDLDALIESAKPKPEPAEEETAPEGFELKRETDTTQMRLL